MNISNWITVRKPSQEWLSLKRLNFSPPSLADNHFQLNVLWDLLQHCLLPRSTRFVLLVSDLLSWSWANWRERPSLLSPLASSSSPIKDFYGLSKPLFWTCGCQTKLSTCGCLLNCSFLNPSQIYWINIIRSGV